MSRPLAGKLLAELETPCLILDMDVVEHNLAVMSDYLRHRSCKLRPHVKNHKSPVLARLQLQAGSTVGGVCASNVFEAEVMIEAGILNILIANQVVTKRKIDRVCALAHRADIMVACDSVRNVLDLATAATAGGVTLGVLVEVDTTMSRCGVRTPREAVELAELIGKSKGLLFRGLMSHQSIAAEPPPDRKARLREGRAAIQKCLDARAAIESTGIEVEIVSSGESWTYDIASEIPGVTEIQGGTYLLMDYSYSYMSAFRQAVTVLGTVVSTPRPGVAIGDVGTLAIACTKGLPYVVNPHGLTVTGLYAHETVLRVGPGTVLHVGDKFALVPGSEDAMVNRWEQYVVVRAGAVEAILDITARGVGV